MITCVFTFQYPKKEVCSNLYFNHPDCEGAPWKIVDDWGRENVNIVVKDSWYEIIQIIYLGIIECDWWNIQ